MIDYTTGVLEYVSVHNVGNKTKEEELTLSKTLLDISDEKVRGLLFKFFLSPFTNPDYYSFTFSNEDFTMNPMFTYAAQIFDKKTSFHQETINIAKHLFEQSSHPQIKSGDLFVAYFTELVIEDEVTDVIGIFKSENRQEFLKLDNRTDDFSIRCDDGINIEKLDKGCLIFNTDRETGFKVCIIDKSSKSTEAQYWKDVFLQITPCSDGYHKTIEFLNITNKFVTKHLKDEFDVSRADQIDMLNRSVEYLKTHDTFNKDDFEEEIFQDSGMINSFRNFDELYRAKYQMEAGDSFEISPHALKRQQRVLKSVLKLDKNFHIYIHGDTNLIEQGVERDGRKYYKIYFENES